jgi:hypothetical protein
MSLIRLWRFEPKDFFEIVSIKFAYKMIPVFNSKDRRWKD